MLPYQSSGPLLSSLNVIQLKVTSRQALHEVPSESHVPLGGRFEGRLVALCGPGIVLLDVGIVGLVLAL